MADGTVTIKDKLRGLLDPVVRLLLKLGVSPMSVTVAGCALSLIGAFAVVRGDLAAGGIVLIMSGLCDSLDGALARKSGTTSVFGAFIDSTLDRIAEIVYFGALIVYYGGGVAHGRIAVPLVITALAGSFLTSYTRARAEGLGLECRVGLLERPERVALLVIGLLFGATVLLVVLACLAVLTVATFVQRIVHVRRVTARRSDAG
jgi:CDP-diacylglycerol--glycerol-3-phosphate 3-phosphatidyltransferase